MVWRLECDFGAFGREFMWEWVSVGWVGIIVRIVDFVFD